MSTPVTPQASLSRRGYVLILFALAMGGFAISTSEFSTMGLMPYIARGLAIDAPQVGHLISAYALGVVVGAPLLAIVGARWPRRTLLLALMGFYAVGNLASALAPDYHSMLLVRFIAGLPHGAYFGVATLVAASISRPDQRGAAVSRVLLGLNLAVLIGNPLATWLGQVAQWRYAYALVAAIAVLTVVLVMRLLPDDPHEPRQRPLRELRAFNRPQVWLALGIGSVGFAGMFCVFSYLAPTLTQVTGVSERWIPFAMCAFGFGGLLGNLAGGWLFDRLQFRAVPLVLLWSMAVLLAWPLAAHSPWAVLPAVVAVGTMGALAPVLQTRLMDVASEAQTLAAASNHAAFNLANALGPWMGGIAISAGLGWTSTGYVGAAAALGGLLVYLWARHDARRAGRLATAG
ncbi:MFS transporter [Xanthomonas graminis]|jgi:DHA1 family inner membrane transport protein|uniref:MFS transporter n=1 Tax=Xanthomonas graminis TaxID=3390026 RepID=UPI00029C9DC3|nr:MFS transporter [Xanthomonas translucens]EKU25922.1 putative sugar efflux porter [Xanthomonas translucens pv. graminis ART-Xtg29]OAX61211.1 MFS transporter [Xanthomonas translucens pv. graminis]UKE53401.1 MFS transporter [Xanthomonas translucens pv. graminis]WIH11144.1 MFS transporter [Xanthomonas translucens pv. graminis]WIH17132.1 MFS transporter [Xanthomonas translucens pv. graminis]